MSFWGRVVLVTGASSGIGRATAEEFAKKGATLAITGRNEANLASVGKKCLEFGAKDVLRINADFASQHAANNLVEKVIEKYKRLDVLINNAGTLKSGTLSQATPEDFDLHFSVNVKSMVLLTQKAMPRLVETKGNVVNVSSIAGPMSYPRLLLYGMSKAAVDKFTKTVALEYAPEGVRVNCVNPATVKSDIWRLDGHYGEKANGYLESQVAAHPIGRNGTAEEIANAILFLASDDSAWTTGNCFLIDGGRGLTVQ